MFTIIWTAVLNDGTALAGNDGFADPDLDDVVGLHEAVLTKAMALAAERGTHVLQFSTTATWG